MSSWSWASLSSSGFPCEPGTFPVPGFGVPALHPIEPSVPPGEKETLLPWEIHLLSEMHLPREVHPVWEMHLPWEMHLCWPLEQSLRGWGE